MNGNDWSAEEEPQELGDVMEWPEQQQEGATRWLVLYEEDYENLAMDPLGSVGVLLTIHQTGEILRLASEILADLSHKDAEPDEPLRDMVRELEELIDDDD